MSEDLINKDNLSLTLLADVFRAAYLDVESVDEQSVLVKEGTININVLIEQPRKRYVWFRAAFSLNKDKSHSQRVEYINKVNRSLEFVRGEVAEWHDGEAIAFDYFLWVEGGTTKKISILL